MSEVKRRRGYTRVSGKNQVTIPVDVLRATGIGPGAELRVEADAAGRIVLVPETSRVERRLAALRELSGSQRGVYPPGYLDELRDEWSPS